MTWQQANVEAAAVYLRERMAAGASDVRIKSVYEGLLDVLDPQRRTTRSRQESEDAAKTPVGKHAERDRRAAIERRSLRERRLVNLGARQGEERRRTPERRSGRDRRNR